MDGGLRVPLIQTLAFGRHRWLVTTLLLSCSAYGAAGAGCLSSAGSRQDNRGGVAFKRAGVQPGDGPRGRVGPCGERSPEEHLAVLGGAGQHAADQRPAAEGFGRTGQKHSRGHHRGQRSRGQEGGENKHNNLHSTPKHTRLIRLVFQNQIIFQQPEDSESKRSSEMTEIIINVRGLLTHLQSLRVPPAKLLVFCLCSRCASTAAELPSVSARAATRSTTVPPSARERREELSFVDVHHSWLCFQCKHH